MWRGSTQHLDFIPKEGVAVLCEGKPNLYPVSGKLQIVVTRMYQSGEGLLQKRFLELKAKLEREGLFTVERKRALPFFPRTIGVVTSHSGAVIHDIMVKIRERMPCTQVSLIDVRVQGEGAAQEIADAVARFNDLACVEVIIVARGGGSLQDLWAFNEEPVVRAIFASRIPVISGVGHEVDVSLSDLVADLRAPTPTAAAELVVPHRRDLLNRINELERCLFDYGHWFSPFEQRVDELERRLQDRIGNRMEQAKLLLGIAQSKLASIRPNRVIENLSGRLDLLVERLFGRGTREFEGYQRLLDIYDSRLQGALSPEKLRILGERTEKLSRRLNLGVEQEVRKRNLAIEGLNFRLESVNPDRVVERGYAVVRLNGKILQSVKGVSEGAELLVHLADGDISSVVKKISS
jgi:exodeoxyribonuclease VII large subunit